MTNKWNDRYSDSEYVFGKEPNVFFKNELAELEAGKILLIGEGEGRNAVHAAVMGWSVDAVDYSDIGKLKADKLASEFGIKINYKVCDFTDIDIPIQMYDAVGIIYIHLEENISKGLFEKIISALKPGGKIIFECFEKEQINYSSGGPKNIDLLYSLEDVVGSFIDLEFKKLSKEKIQLNEGAGHQGTASVIRFVGAKVSGQ